MTTKIRDGAWVSSLSNNIRMTAFDFTYRGFVFEASLRKRTEYSDGWVVIRRNELYANIPPCKEILTDKGWEISTVAKGAPHVFFDVDDLVANCEVQIDSLLRKAS